MIFERFEEKGLSHYSYAVGSEENGQIAIIDPRRDVEVYLDFAEKNQYVISHVFETHIHADYASGARELAKRARATLVLSGYDEGEKYEINFPHRECFDRDRFRLGSIVLEALHTPGHTPEHLSFLLYDLTVPKEVPEALFSGDFLFVGSLGRPDLLGKEATVPLAKELYRSVKEKLSDLPNELEIYPAHGAGSFCGAGMGGRASSTLGYERLLNPYLQPNVSEKEFVELILSRTPLLPSYFFRMKEYNSCDDRSEVEFPKPFEVSEFKKFVDRGDVVIDLRDQRAFGAGHIPKSICIGAGPKVGFWASWAVPYDRPILLVTDDPTLLADTVHALARVGFDKIHGYLKGGWETWKRAGFPTSKTEQVSPGMIKEKKNLYFIDVRTSSEWSTGHIPGAKHIPCAELGPRLSELPKGNLVFVCAGGYRSTLAASLAERAGHTQVGHIPGGMPHWQSAGGEVITH